MKRGQKRKLIDVDDIIGKKYGKLTVLSYEGRKNKCHVYRCRCECGKESIILRTSLLNGRTKSCGQCKSTEIVKENDYYRYYCTNGHSFIFDECDLSALHNMRCTVSERGYVSANRKKILVDRLILGVAADRIVDHINGNPFDNRRSNLRVVNAFENNWNAKMNSRNTTGFKGVYPDNKSSRYHARICEHSNRHYLGSFENPEDAAKAYDQAARKYFGEYATLNFPDNGEQSCNRGVEVIPA